MSFTPNSAANNGDFTSDQAVSTNLSRPEQLQVLRGLILELERTEQTMDSSNSTCVGEIEQNGFGEQIKQLQNDQQERISELEKQLQKQHENMAKSLDDQFSKFQNDFLERLIKMEEQHQEEKDKNGHILERISELTKQMEIISDQQKKQQQQIDQLSTAIQEKCAKIAATGNFDELLNAVDPAYRDEEFSIHHNSVGIPIRVTGNAYCSVFAKCSIPSCDSGIFYFEMEIINLKNCAIIGLATKAMPLDQRVGMLSDNYGCTTNGLFLMNGSFKNGKTKFSAGDIVGFGINLASGRIIFTKNGLPLDSTNWFVSPSAAGDPLFACVSLHNSGDKIIANFGPHFKFDLASVEIYSNQKQNFLDANACHNRIQITGAESLTAIYIERPGFNSVFAKYPISNCDSYIFYFETLIEKMGGDIIGFGVIMDTERIINTKNGQLIDSSDLFISSFSSIADHLFPCFTLNKIGDTIIANFGPNFKFDISRVECLSKQQKQNCWDSNDCHSDLEIIGDKLSTVNYKANGNAWRSIFTKYSSQTSNCDIIYFEIHVVNVKFHVLIGFAPKQQSSLCGTVRDCIGTFAYEGNGAFWINGAKINGNSTTKFTRGDIIGCGTHLETRQIIFTKNGQRLDQYHQLAYSFSN
ncbi:hypothetical protein niasHS_006007 [Heterodera schachtii]|uniref:B30.2/SPRY domain-containing protein n=1 Tax=Heterodera schachtii TaxID=97005 RepID=A0ABD2K187_HETSC